MNANILREMWEILEDEEDHNPDWHKSIYAKNAKAASKDAWAAHRKAKHSGSEEDINKAVAAHRWASEKHGVASKWSTGSKSRNQMKSHMAAATKHNNAVTALAKPMVRRQWQAFLHPGPKKQPAGK